MSALRRLSLLNPYVQPPRVWMPDVPVQQEDKLKCETTNVTGDVGFHVSAFGRLKLRNEDLAEWDQLTTEEWKISCGSGLRGPLKVSDLNMKGLREALRRIEALKYFCKRDSLILLFRHELILLDAFSRRNLSSLELYLAKPVAIKVWPLEWILQRKQIL